MGMAKECPVGIGDYGQFQHWPWSLVSRTLMPGISDQPHPGSSILSMDLLWKTDCALPLSATLPGAVCPEFGQRPDIDPPWLLAVGSIVLQPTIHVAQHLPECHS